MNKGIAVRSLLITVLAVSLGLVGSAAFGEPEWTPNDDSGGGFMTSPNFERDFSREAIEAKLNNSRGSADAATEKGESLLSLAQEQEKEGNQELALTLLQQILRLDLPDNGSADPLLIDQPAAGVEITVSDAGPGIEPKHLARIFDPFFTTKELTKGTGLGLSICHRIVEQHGGTIEADSLPNQGTTFRIRLPSAKATGAEE